MKADKFLRVCRKCKASCCRMGGPNFTEKEMKKVLKAGHKNYFFEVRNKIYELKSKKGICPYLKKDNSCEIQKLKPLLCLSWPVFPSFRGKKGEYTLMECPLTKYLSKEDIDKCKKEASKISKQALEVALDYSTLPKSDVGLIKRRFNKFKQKRL